MTASEAIKRGWVFCCEKDAPEKLACTQMFPDSFGAGERLDFAEEHFRFLTIDDVRQEYPGLIEVLLGLYLQTKANSSLPFDYGSLDEAFIDYKFGLRSCQLLPFLESVFGSKNRRASRFQKSSAERFENDL